MKKITFVSVCLLLTVLFSYGQWSTTYLSDGTIRMSGAVLGNKAYFAGGMVVSGSDWIDTDKVEIYDTETGIWEMDYLSQPRQIISSTTCGGFIFFAGGLSNWVPSSRVDMFNSLGLWESKSLSIPRFALSVAGKDEIVLFAGGGSLSQVYNRVDIYNINTQQWSVDTLSIPRTYMGCATAGDLAFFAGGGNAANSVVYSRVDIYNFSTGTWDTASLSQARSFPGVTVAQGKVVFAGGSLSNGVPSGRVDVFDTQTGIWDTTGPLSVPRAFYSQSATVCGIAYFVGSGSFGGNWINGTDTIDVYDPVENAWSVMTLPDKVTENAVVAIENALLSAGGFYENDPPNGIALNTVEIYTDPVCSYGVNVGNTSEKSVTVDLTVYPNPVYQSTTFSYALEESGQVTLQIFDSFGRLVDIPVNAYQQKVEQQVLWNAEACPAGIYFYRIQAGNEVGSGKIIKW